MKDTFILRTEWWDAISLLEQTEQAEIFANLFHFHSGNENLINLKNQQVKLVWSFLKPNLERNIEEYDKRRETSKQNGLLGGRPSKNQELTENKKPNENLKKPKKPNETLSVFVPVSDSAFDNTNNAPSAHSKQKTIEEKKQEFREALKPHLEKYGQEMLIDFFNYWTEETKDKKKLRWELQKTWNTAGRLATWKKNEKPQFAKTESINFTEPKINPRSRP